MTPAKATGTLALAAVSALALIVAIAVAGPWGWQQWQLSKPGFHETDCWFGKKVTGPARCGFMVVRETRQNPESRTIRLPVVIFEASRDGRGNGGAAPEPILYLTGGPGGSAYLGDQQQVDSWWLERRIFPPDHPLIVMGQRGTGLKQPDFDCEEFNTPELLIEAHARGTPPPDVRPLAIAAAVACAQRLQAEGIDLTAYNSRETAADIAELREALGIEAWSLYGISYGTRLALSVLRYRPEGVRAVILDSVFPPDATNLIDRAAFFRKALHRYLTGCTGRSPCEPVDEAAWQTYLAVRAQLRERPVEIDLSAIDPDVDLIVTVDDRMFDDLLFQALYGYESREFILPAIRGLARSGVQPVGGVDRNSEVPLRELLKGTLDALSDGSEAVYLSYECSEEAAFESPEAIAAAATAAAPFGHLVDEDSDAYLCPVWPGGKADPVENTPVTSAVPALLLSGLYDPVTPPDLARQAARHLANSHVFAFPDAGHGVIYEVDCAGSLIADFLKNPRRLPKGDCRRSDFWSWQ